MPFECIEEGAVQLPDSDGVVSTGGGDLLAIGAESDAQDSSAMAL